MKLQAKKKKIRILESEILNCGRPKNKVKILVLFRLRYLQCNANLRKHKVVS